MNEVQNPQPQGKSVSDILDGVKAKAPELQKSFLESSLKDRLKMVGVTVTLPEGVDPYGIEESLDLFDLLATVANKVVNKDGWLDFTLAQKAFATYTGAKEIPKELMYITETELETILTRVRSILVFQNPDKAKLEVLVEKIVFVGLYLLSSITEYTR